MHEAIVNQVLLLLLQSPQIRMLYLYHVTMCYMLIMPWAHYVYFAPSPLVNEVTDRWLQLSRFAIGIKIEPSISFSVADPGGVRVV